MAKKSKQDDQPTTITPAGSEDVKVSAHPRAQRQIRRWKGMGELAGFFLMAWLSWRSGTDFVHLRLRAMQAGPSAYVAVWAVPDPVWRQIYEVNIRELARILEDGKLVAMDADQ